MKAQEANVLLPIIAIDGHAGSGKSTVSREVARRLGFLHINTGILYRALTWKALQMGIPIDAQAQIEYLAQTVHLEPFEEQGSAGVRIDGQDVTPHLRTTEINSYVSQVSAYPQVREAITKQLQALPIHKGIVMDGRDIGTVVFPMAPLKLFLTASLEARAQRQLADKQLKDPDLSLPALIAILAERDRQDSERPLAPLRQAPDAIRIDTTLMESTAVIDEILRLWDNCNSKSRSSSCSPLHNGV